jgi:hypothetical protein
MRTSMLIAMTAALSTACTTKGELGEAKFQVGNNWNSGLIAQGSQFHAEAKLPFFGGSLEIKSSDENILQPHNGQFIANELGQADLIAIDESKAMVDYLNFEVKEATEINLSDAMFNDIPRQFAMLLDSELEISLRLYDDEGQMLLHDNLIEMLESEDRFIRSRFHNNQVRLSPYTYGEEKLLFRAGELEEQYSIQAISPTQMSSFAINLNAHQPTHPNPDRDYAAPYGLEWVEVIVEAQSLDGRPVLIPSSDLYIHGARDTWRAEDDINRIWALLSWGEFPMVSLTPPPTESDDTSSTLEIPEHNQ